MSLSLFLLGPPRVEIDGEAIAFPRQKSLALLVYLAVTGEQQRRDSLAALLWPESADARGSLRRELSSLKSALGGGDWLDADRENVTLTGAVRLDVDDFLAAVESGDPSQFAQAAELYRGDFLAGFSLADAPDFDDWRFFQGEEFRRLLASGLERLIVHHQSAGNPDVAIPFARQLLALDNLHEPSHRILMRLYALAGQQAAALRQYDECLRLLDAELGVPPEDETTELYEAIRIRRIGSQVAGGRSQVAGGRSQVAGGRSQVASDKSQVTGQESPNLPIPSPQPPIPPHNLPPQATPFVGRQREVAEVRELLSPAANRLVTITGVGGMGKSRLGLAVAEALLADFPDGVWFVPLAPVETAEGVPRAIAAALSLSGSGDSRSSVLTFLRGKRLLLLLDNFEHLLDGADFLAELLPSAPGVKLLVTSQERLNLLEESLYPLGGLDEASRLFVERAQRVQPDFDPAAEGKAIETICRLVEGMPLAIELAASWVRVMACAEIAEEIQRSADFLASNTRNLPARHRSLRAVFERSWALLDEAEQNLLARLSVFQGGFTRQAAQSVANAVASATPLQLAGLVDHSFLRRQNGERFDMHGLLHRFAAERLAADSGVETDALQRHAAFYADLVAQAGWELEPGDPAASAVADRDGPNVLAAWRWGVEQRDQSIVDRMVSWLGDYFRRRGDLLGGRAIFRRAVEAFRSSATDIESTGFLGSLLSQLGQCGDHDNLAENVDQLHEAIRYLRQVRSLRPLDLAQALAFLALMQASFGQNIEGAEHIEEALAIFREAQNDLGTSAALNSMSVLFWGWGRLREAQKYAEEAARILEGREHASYLISRYGIGSILCGRGHFRRAEAILQGLIPQFKALDKQEMAYYSRLTFADLYTATGNFPSAKEQYIQAYVFADTLDRGYQVTTGMFLSPAALARLSGEPDAEQQLLDGLAVARQIGFEQRISTSLHHLARLRHDQRDYESALALLDEALTIARKIDFRYATALALTALGHSQLALKETEAARTAYAEALDIAEAEGIDRIACDALTGVAQLLHRQGNSPLALSLLHFAHSAEASEWETARRAERLLTELPQDPTRPPIPSLEEAIHQARAALDGKTTGGRDDKMTSSLASVLPSSLHNLPSQTTPFVGRGAEMRALREMLGSDSHRLLTITGPGGVGKSRLGLVVAETLLPDFPDGVWFVPLAQVEAAEGVPRAIAAALTLSGSGDSRSSVLAFLRDKRLLLLLDNFEHLLDGADFLAELLPSAPGVKLLVTSQERLNLLEESLYPLGGLDEASRLFVERAQRVQPDFDPAVQAEAVATVCRLVEGMPLAIELAASWVRVMTCAEIAEEIQRSADFLTTTLRNLPARHRSLRAVFERSWALLDEAEQNLLARLSVFQGGFTRQAAQSVANAVASATPRQLAGLVDHSFLRRQADDRFDMHGLLHRFAAEQLAADATVAANARQRHADFYADLVAQAGWELEPGDPVAGEAADRDGPNVLAAWRWGVENRDESIVERIMRWLVDYFRRRVDYSGGEAAFESAFQAFRSMDGQVEKAGLLGSLLLQMGKCAMNAQLQGRSARFQESVALLRRAEPPVPLNLSQSLVALGMTYASLGRNPEGVELLAEAIGILRAAGNDLGVGATLRDWGMLETGWGRLREAERRLEESVQVLEGRERKSYTQSNFMLGNILMMRGYYRRAEALLRRTLPFFVEQGEDALAGYTLRNLGDLYVAIGDFVQAKHCFAEVDVRFNLPGLSHLAISTLCLSPGALARLSGAPNAEELLLDGLALSRQVGFRQQIAKNLHHLARLRHDQRDYESALALLDEALTIARKIDFRYATALVRTAQGHSQLALKQSGAARTAYAEALDIAEREGIDRIACDALTGVAQLLHRQGNSPLALSLLHFAHSAEASEWETARRAERLLTEFPESGMASPTSSLDEAIRLARAALDDAQSTNQPINQSPIHQSPIHLPTPTTSFIGRETELAELSALLSRPEVRLATVVAPGGMGKTRFAIEAARRLAGDFPDGVWFLSLVGVNEASQMLSALVQLLDAPMGAGGAKEAVLRFLSRRRLLLVLDNFEQLADSADVLAEIVQSAPDVKLLVTSRMRLNLREEWAFPLAGLTTADNGQPTAEGRIESGSAVRLFVERAQQVQPDFDAGAEGQAVAAICRAVEGMPLGIELAASWLRAMNCGEIADEIRRDVDFLSTSLRNVPEQHRSMRVVFERSWGLLSAEEQRGLARLSVFQGGFTRAAAEAVAEVRLPLLSALVDHSLVRHSANGRYDIHELLRQFAAEQLDSRESAETVRDKHADYFLHRLIERREELAWRSLEQPLAELIPERENLFAGWQWASQRGLFALLREAATVLPLYCNLTNAREIGWQLFAVAIASVEEKTGAADDRPGLLGVLRFRQQVELRNSHNQPEAYLKRLLETRELLLASKSDNREEMARLSGAIGTQTATVGRGEEGAAWMEEAIRTFQETGNFFEMGKIYYRFALLRTGEGKVRLADETFGKVVEAWQQAKLPPYPVINRGIVYHMQGRYAEMYQLWEKGAEVGNDPFMRGFSSMGGTATIEIHLAEASVALGALDEAVTHFQKAKVLYEAQGGLWEVVLGFQFSYGTVLRLQGQMEAARRQIKWEVATVRSTGFEQRIATRLHEFARLEYDEGRYVQSEAALAEALAIAESIDFRFVVALVLCQMGHTAAAQGKPEAADYYRRALEIAAEQGMNGIVVDVVQGAAGLAAAAGEVVQAVEWLALAASHPNGEWETQQKAQKTLAELEGRLPEEEFSAAQTQGRSAELESVISAVLALLV